ncbi:hypothetical protein Ami103574_02115 [Aminipila butyrica]|uniref:O-antigen ligase-related domain-containing protein n=1 Tax=Aminipila butyrica TaxID=433296 RepID=A0A858BSW7_9FIRM|nr:O-antigen ligase family protein [Aminipila butyrica]QIB68178.1 hypothetical protein Ami103574_02115 [Aminipila butyrica]
MTKKATFLPIVFGIVLIFATALMGSFDLLVQKWAALAALVIILIWMGIPKFKSMWTIYTTPLYIAIFGYVIWSGLSIFYADVTKAALFEFTKLVVAAAVFLTVLVWTPATKKGVKTVWKLLATSTAFFGIISVDAASNGPLAGAFKAFMSLFTSNMQNWGVFEDGIRITGIFGNANTFAGLMALGVFLSLSLVMVSQSKKEKAFATALLAWNSLPYLLLFSLGSLFIFFLACLLMIAVSKKGERLSLFLLMAETGLVTLFFAGISLITLGSTPLLPLVALVLNAVVLWFVDQFIRQAMTQRLTAHSKSTFITGTAVLGLLVVYLIAALNVTGPLSLASSETVMRAAYLNAGSYELTATTSSANQPSSETAASVRIVTQNKTQLKLHSSTQLYNGPLENAAFTVPEDSRIVKLYFTGAASGSLLEQVTYGPAPVSGTKPTAGEFGSVKLNYKLLPAIAANRIQDLGANENSIQRMVFFEDGFKLFRQSPIIGHGLSGFEVGIASVQNFYYETNYVHNHYIQTLCDLGIIGFAFFLSILILSVLFVIKLLKVSKKSEYQNVGSFALPVLAACLLQMFGQAATDLTWSMGTFLITAFSLLALTIVVNSKNFGEVSQEITTHSIKNAALDTVEFTSPSGKESWDPLEDYASKGFNPATSASHPAHKYTMAVRASIFSLSLLMGLLLSLNLYAYYKASTGNATINQIATLSKLDKFEGDDYKTSYIVTASTYGLQENMVQANKYAEELTDSPDVVLNYLLPFYFNTGQDDKLFETASIAAHDGKASPETWNRLFEIFDTAVNPNRDNPMPIILHLFKNKEYYIDGLLGYYRDLQARNAAYLDDAMLDAGNTAFIGKLLGIEQLDKSGLLQAIDVFSNTIFDSAFAVDVNNDQIPDNISILSGQTSWGASAVNTEEKQAPSGSGFDGSMKASSNTSMDLNVYCVKGGEYTLRLSGLTGINGSPAPQNIVAALDGQPLAVQYDGDGAFIQVTLKGAATADKEKGIQSTAASTEKITLTFPSGGEMTAMTLKK